MAAAVATHRVRVNRIDLIASGHQGPDQQASVGLDPDRDLCWVLSVGGHQGVQFPHPTQPFGDPLTWHDIPPAVRPPQHQPGHGLPPRACGLRCLRVLTGWWLRRSLPSKTRAAPLGSLPSTPPPIRFLVADDRTSSSAAPAPRVWPPASTPPKPTVGRSPGCRPTSRRCAGSCSRASACPASSRLTAATGSATGPETPWFPGCWPLPLLLVSSTSEARRRMGNDGAGDHRGGPPTRGGLQR
jgi:hypothetical protein